MVAHRLIDSDASTEGCSGPGDTLQAKPKGQPRGGGGAEEEEERHKLKESFNMKMYAVLLLIAGMLAPAGG